VEEESLATALLRGYQGRSTSAWGVPPPADAGHSGVSARSRRRASTGCGITVYRWADAVASQSHPASTASHSRPTPAVDCASAAPPTKPARSTVPHPAASRLPP
jgi:hypothetical protein